LESDGRNEAIKRTSEPEGQEFFGLSGSDTHPGHHDMSYVCGTVHPGGEESLGCLFNREQMFARDRKYRAGHIGISQDLAELDLVHAD
jgi:hypothetical protein